MSSDESSRDDLAELADLVAQLADQLKRLQPDAAELLDGIRDRAARLSAPDRGPARVQSLSAEAISVTEPDGSVRLLMTGQATFPTRVQMAGELIEHPRPGIAGLLFFNDEGDECGGLVFGGAAGSQGGSLTFDKYQGDQVIQLLHDESDHGRTAALLVADQPDVPFPELNRRFKEVQALPEDDRGAALQRWHDDGLDPATRVVIGRVGDGSAHISLGAEDGRARIVVAVTPDGTPSIRFLDADQNITWQAP